MLTLPNAWHPMQHQKQMMDYLFKGGNFPDRKRAFACWHRRAGKDAVMINTLAVASQLRVGTFWHLLPTLNQGRKVIWNGIDASGRRVIHQAFPKELIDVPNENEMTLRLKNGSFYQVVGSDNYNSLVGSNPVGVVFSEWALADPQAWNFVRPILLENGGFAAFITTPRGKNHAHAMMKMARASDDWFYSHKTVDMTERNDGSRIITPAMVEQERGEGVPEEVIQQEYFCSWEGINFGSIYGHVLRRYEDHQCVFPEAWNPRYPVFTAWDIGHRDATSIWFYQIIHDEVFIIDFREGTGGDVDDWLIVMKSLPYAYGTPTLPHDAKNKTFTTKYTSAERFYAAQLRPYIVPNMSIAAGIQAARSLFKHVWFNTGNANVVKGIEHLEQYHYEYDEVLKTFSLSPAHDEHSHASDAFRMLALSENVMRVSGPKQTIAGNPSHAPLNPVGRALHLENLFADRAADRERGIRRI
jgi:hypothetical protein